MKGRTPFSVYSLGGSTAQAWIAGKIEADEGVLGGQAVAILPIEVSVMG